jgi:hypothetical protein
MHIHRIVPPWIELLKKLNEFIHAIIYSTMVEYVGFRPIGVTFDILSSYPRARKRGG